MEQMMIEIMTKFKFFGQIFLYPNSLES